MHRVILESGGRYSVGASSNPQKMLLHVKDLDNESARVVLNKEEAEKLVLWIMREMARINWLVV